MTINEKLSEIELHYNYWIGNFERKDLSTNNVRIVAEAICKTVILSKKGETLGTEIILGKNLSIPNRRRTKQGMEINFAELITVLNDLQCFNPPKKSIGLQFELIRDRTNPSSHSKNKLADKTSLDDLEICNTSIKVLLKWLYLEIMNVTIPINVENAFEGRQDAELMALHTDKWSEFKYACREFDNRIYQYILVSPESISESQHVVQEFLKLPWRLFVDFNHKTDEEENGLLYNFNNLVGSGYKKAYTLNDSIEFDPDFPNYWFLANGQGVIPPEPDYKTWRHKYKKILSETLYKAFNKGSRIKARIVVLVNISKLYAEVIIDEFDRMDGQNLHFVLCSEYEDYDSIFEKFENVELIRTSPVEIANGIHRSYMSEITEVNERQILIPHFKDEKKIVNHINLSQDHYDYLYNLGIEIVYRGIENSINSDDENQFFKGNIISWRDLAEQKDITRNTLESLHKRLENKLAENKLDEITLVHEAGAGGTTISRRIAYDFSTQYPTVILKKYLHKKTIDGFRIIYDQYTKGSLPLLIVIESFEVKDSNLLFKDLSNAKKNAVILLVHRGKIQKPVSNKFSLKAQLEGKELLAFESSYIILCPDKKEKLRQITNEFRENPGYISPVLYALTAFGKDYNGIESYVAKCLDGITLEQKKVTGFICLVYYYTQKSVPFELFSALFNIDRSKCDLLSLLGNENPLLELLHQEADENNYYNVWRPRYAILGTEAMTTIIGGDAQHKNNWKTHLANWLIELVKYISLSMPYLDDETLQIFNALFIERSFFDETSKDKEFTKAIQDLLTPSDGIAIFEALTNAYPNEAHFHGHFARYLYSDKIGIKDYDHAIIEAEASLEILGDNSTLLHTLGMCYREKAEDLINSYDIQGLSIEEAEEKVKNLTESACRIFDESIDADSYNIYSYESQIRVILKTLDFAFKVHPSSSKETFITNPLNSWYAEMLDKVSRLLEEALYVIEQSKKLENKERIQRSAGYVNDCEGIFYKTLGKHLAAKSKFEDLIKNTPKDYDYMRPHYRRMFVMCLLASKSKDHKDLFQAWHRISSSELMQCVQYLESNIFEDPNNTQNIRLWLQAIRHLQTPSELNTCISKIGAWTQVITQSENSLLEGYYYLYVLNAIKAISDGNTFDPTAMQVVKEVQSKMKPFIKNEKFCYEWFGRGIGIQQMVSHKKLGEFTTDFFEKNKTLLVEVTGRIKTVDSFQQGTITLDCGLEAFFVPSVSGFTERNTNDRIKCFIGFRYDQIQAWSVILQSVSRDSSVKKRDIIELNSMIDPVEDSPALNKDLVTREDQNDNSRKILVTEKLTGPKILGKIELEEKKTRAEKIILQKPIKDNNYEGIVTILRKNSGYIKIDGLDKDIAFNYSHCKNVKFSQLSTQTRVTVKVNFLGENALVDFSNRNYVASEINKYE